MVVLVDDRYVLYEIDHALRSLELAYAATVHKSQGNEFPAVIIPVLGTVPQLSYRNLLYTGVTRAKKLCILAGSQPTVKSMVVKLLLH